jgi:hypothetical protein
MLTEVTDEIRTRRVAIARDVIAQLDAQQLQYLNKGVYLQGYIPEETLDAATDLQEIVDIASNTCRVCAKGAMFLSRARLYDGVPIGRIRYDGESSITSAKEHDFFNATLMEDFDKRQLDLIEHAFEMWAGDESTEYMSALRVACQFGLLYKHSHAARLRAIMANIVDNGGEFIP